MLIHNVPWQYVLYLWLKAEVAFVAVMLLSLISGYLNWWVPFTAVFLAIGFYFIIWLIPTMLNLSRSYFTLMALHFPIHILVTIITFALHHMSSGLIGASGPLAPTFTDALYFSVTTFTTLGYGDLQPLPEMRLATSVEALAGMISVSIAVAMIWLWCQEHLIPKEMALMDGNRFHKKSLTPGRLRIRTITGKERKIKDWHPTPEPGEVFRYDSRLQEWLEVHPDEELPENTQVIDAKQRKRPKQRPS